MTNGLMWLILKKIENCENKRGIYEKERNIISNFNTCFDIFCMPSKRNAEISAKIHFSSEKLHTLMYSEPPVEMFGKKIFVTRKVLGKSGSYCRFTQISDPVNSKSTINCKFSKEQTAKLVDAMKNNKDSGQPLRTYVKDRPEGRTVRVSGGDKATRIWTEYFNNQSICKVTSSPEH